MLIFKPLIPFCFSQLLLITEFAQFLHYDSSQKLPFLIVIASIHFQPSPFPSSIFQAKPSDSLLLVPTLIFVFTKFQLITDQLLQDLILQTLSLECKPTLQH